MTQLVKGSMAAIAKATNTSLAEAFMDVDAVIIVDVSGSMAMEDSTGGRSRYQQACQELATLQANMPGKIAVMAFSDTCKFCPSGVPSFADGSTDMAAALRFAKMCDVPGIRFVLISDGEPNEEAEALAVARTYTNRIDTVFVGPEERPAGREFLRRLSAESGGVSVTADRVKELASNVERLLLASA